MNINHYSQITKEPFDVYIKQFLRHESSQPITMLGLRQNLNARECLEVKFKTKLGSVDSLKFQTNSFELFLFFRCFTELRLSLDLNIFQDTIKYEKKLERRCELSRLWKIISWRNWNIWLKWRRNFSKQLKN